MVKLPDTKLMDYHLRPLLLCCHSAMSAAVASLMKAYRFKLRLEVTGKSNPGYALFVTMAMKLDIDIAEVGIESKRHGAAFGWLSDHSTSNLRAWIPDMQHRDGDMHVLLPFLFEYHLVELRKHEPDFPAPRVDSLYVLLLWEICFGKWQLPLAARVIKDLLAWEKTAVLTAHNYIGSVGEEIPIVSSKVTTLNEVSQLYLGFWHGSQAWDMVKGSKIEFHAFNQRTRKFLNVAPLSPGGSSSAYPVLVRQYDWDIEQLSTITTNAWALDRHALRWTPDNWAKVRNCLILRLHGKAEEEIQCELGFSNSEKYYEWQVAQMLDNRAGRRHDPLEAWLKACEFFELEPNQSLLDQVLGTASNHDKNSNKSHTQPDAPPITPEPVKEFTPSPDYRSVISANSEHFSLTPKQAGVIKLLHYSFINETPEISQAHIIEEVYGYVKENNLKKLFANNKAWIALIESGQRKGLVRLIIHRTDD